MASLFAAPAARVTYSGVMPAEVAAVVLPVLATALPVMAGLRSCFAAVLPVA